MNKDRKIAWITGGTRGLGRALTEKFHDVGYRVIATYASNECSAEALREKKGIDVIKADVRSASSLQCVFDHILVRYGKLDVLVNNAGIGWAGPVEQMNDDMFADILDVNVSGKYRCAILALPLLRESASGCIINVASAAGVSASGEMAAYCSAAAGTIMLTNCLARALSHWKIRVNCISPSMMAAGMSTKFFSSADMEFMARNNPTGRLCTHEDAVNCVLWLCSSESSYINGTNILITGGR